MAEGLEKGMAEGVEKGIAEGIEKGMEKGKQLAFNQMLLLVQDIQSRNFSNQELSNKYNISDGDKNTWHGSFIEIKYSPPYYCAMVCAVRFSKKMMECIHNYTLKHGTLGFIEALFPTVAKRNMLKYTVISELSEIHHSYFFTGNDVDKKNIYHPVKNVNKHIEFRKLLEKR
jgi:hypothetical protein